MEKMESETNYVDDHYEIPLPFRKEDVYMPMNKAQAILRANWLKRSYLGSYVDDCLRAEQDEKIAIERIENVTRMCARGGFRLTKFTSNKRQVLEAIPEEERAKELNSIDLGRDHLPIERALGVQWFVESDELGFKIVLKDKPLTRRGILSTISSIYDPIGMAAPILLPGKRILQDLCKAKNRLGR